MSQDLKKSQSGKYETRFIDIKDLSEGELNERIQKMEAEGYLVRKDQTKMYSWKADHWWLALDKEVSI